MCASQVTRRRSESCEVSTVHVQSTIAGAHGTHSPTKRKRNSRTHAPTHANTHIHIHTRKPLIQKKTNLARGAPCSSIIATAKHMLSPWQAKGSYCLGWRKSCTSCVHKRLPVLTDFIHQAGSTMARFPLRLRQLLAALALIPLRVHGALLNSQRPTKHSLRGWQRRREPSKDPQAK